MALLESSLTGLFLFSWVEWLSIFGGSYWLEDGSVFCSYCGNKLAGVSETTAREALRLAKNKLPVKTKFVMKEESNEEGENNEN